MVIFFSAKVSAEGIWRLDGTLESSLPRNFRAIEDLRISGSGQPTASSLLKLKEYLAEKMTANSKIYIVDLREESHGFANGFPVSYYENKNLANFFKRRDEIETVEIEQLTDMLDRKIKFVPLGNEDKPEAVFYVAEGDTPLAVYEYCNLHGLWKAAGRRVYFICCQSQ